MRADAAPLTARRTIVVASTVFALSFAAATTWTAPATFFASGVAFYLALPALGLDLDAARGQGWLLGPFQLDSLWVGPSLSLWHQVQWQVLPAAWRSSG